MQTFLPYADFKRSAKCLDNKRLGKQRVEAWQILKGDFPNHPASKMWRPYRATLVIYIEAIVDEWVCRGYEDNIWQQVIDYCRKNTVSGDGIKWLGGPIHESHRSNLLLKDYEHYSQYWTVDKYIPYYWPEVDYDRRLPELLRETHSSRVRVLS